MLFTLTTTHYPATDLGFLLHKNPEKLQSFALPFGQVHVFYPEATAERCTAAILLDVDPIGLVRKQRAQERNDLTLQQYVNDRPYTASSFLSVAIARVFGSALKGRSVSHQELADTPIPLEAVISVVRCRGAQHIFNRLFEPLGYTVEAIAHPLHLVGAESSTSAYHTLTLRGTARVADLLTHLYVLIPVIDNDKHYWVGEEEAEKLLRHGEGWLARHPERTFITQRYLKYQARLAHTTLQQLNDEHSVDPQETDEEQEDNAEEKEQTIRLHDQRLLAVAAELKKSNATTILDLGCGEGKLLQHLRHDPTYTKIVGVDISHQILERAKEKLKLDRLPAQEQDRIRLLQSSLTYRDRRLVGYDAAAVVEVIEHLDPARLHTFARILFSILRPTTVVMTTPNREYNVLLTTLPANTFRHSDHRFEWTREEFATWAETCAELYEYTVHIAPIGPEDPNVGAPSQMAVFTRKRTDP